MKSIILCEGGTDLTLIQYFMEAGNQWKFSKNSGKLFSLKLGKELKKEDKNLILGATGGCSQIPDYFAKILENNRISSSTEEIYNNIIIITDNDDPGTSEEIIEKVTANLKEKNIEFTGTISNDKWIECSCENALTDKIKFRILLLIIPFDENGALETFLLKAISKNDNYDGEIIKKIDRFVEGIDFEKRYLKQRRYITKAKFDVYFSVRTPLEQFIERRNILRNVKWEDYAEIQKSFKKLKNL